MSAESGFHEDSALSPSGEAARVVQQLPGNDRIVGGVEEDDRHAEAAGRDGGSGGRKAAGSKAAGSKAAGRDAGRGGRCAGAETAGSKAAGRDNIIEIAGSGVTG